MEFLKRRKNFTLWIITAFVVVSGCDGLQGVPTWICLGLKSPFIEFSNEIEMLANNSIPLNITKDEQALMHQEGLRKLGTFIKPVDLRDSTTGFVKANLTKKIPQNTQQQMQRRMHPIQEEMDKKEIILLDEETDENGLPASLTDEDRKFIVPMALKNPMPPDARIPQPPPMYRASSMLLTTTQMPTTIRTTTTTLRAPTAAASTRTKKMTMPQAPEFAANIDDLKNHILFLQNLTKHDSNFQSKFVVFPSLQKDKPTTTTTLRPLRPIFQYSAPIPPPTRKIPAGVKPGGQPFGGYYHNEDDGDSMSVFLSQPGQNPRDKITIVPQVLLLNDQTTNSNKNDAASAAGGGGGRRRINTNKSPTLMPPMSTLPYTTTTTTSTTTTTTTELPMTTTQNSRRATKRPVCIRNPESPKCIRQRKREEQQRQLYREQLLREQEQYLQPRYEPIIQTLNNTKRFAVSIEIPDSFKVPLNETTTPTMPHETELQFLSRPVRSHHKRRNIGGGLQGRLGDQDKIAGRYGSPSFSFERGAIMTSAAVANEREFMLAHMDQMNGMLPNSSTPSPTVAAYSEPIDLNPDNCYLVDGMSYGQKKQCVLNTSVMPAISRGARAAIQECQYQFKNRRWNCSTVEDNTVFGPMTGLGSPEMAFIHALAAATVTSFIARACRDGQLASCGCSRGSRPKQLHDDWTWGGCGDNLEYAYKFATDFIDIREKETKRGTRGVGNPERRRGGRFQQQQKQQKQQRRLRQGKHNNHLMQADDANINSNGKRAKATLAIESAAVATSTNVKLSATTRKTAAATTTTTTTATTTMKTIAKNKQDNSNGFEDSSKSITITNEDIKQQGAVGNNQQISNKTDNSIATNNSNNNEATPTTTTSTISTSTTKSTTTTISSLTAAAEAGSKDTTMKKKPSTAALLKQDDESSSEEDLGGRIKPEDLLELKERITKEILNSKLQEKEMLELQAKINREILNSKVFNMEQNGGSYGNGNSNNKRGKRKRKNQRAVNGNGGLMADAGYSTNTNIANINTNTGTSSTSKWKNGASLKARSLMNLHNNEAGRRAVIKKTRITCKCHGVSGSCSLITCWQQLSSIREIGDYLREKYEESTEVKLNKRGRLQVKDPQFKVPTAHDLVYLDESPDWCRNNRQLQWPGTHGRVCNKTSSGLDGCGILCCGRGYNTKNIVVRERCNCKFHWCCHVKCDVCVKVLEEHTCK